MSDYTLPSNPQDRKKIKDAIYEMQAALQFIDDKREFIKDVANMLKEKYEIPVKISTKLAKTLHKDNYDDVTQEVDSFTSLFETLFNNESSEREADYSNSEDVDTDTEE